MDGLELMLIKHSTEYPALVKEVLRSESPDSLTAKCSSISGGWCWLIARSQLFIWKLTEGIRTSKMSFNLPLQRSGLPFNQESVVIIDKESGGRPACLVSSGEGTLRYWNTIGEAYTDTIIDIQSEVVLSLHRTSNCHDDYYNFLLATTTGSLFQLESDNQGRIRWNRIGNLEEKSMSKKLSSLFWSTPVTAHTCNRILRIAPLGSAVEDVEDMEEDDGLEEEVNTIVAVSTGSIALFSVFDSCLQWTISTTKLLETLLQHKISSHTRFAPNPPVWCLDAVFFRAGALFLFGVGTVIDGVDLALGYVDMRKNLKTAPSSLNSLIFLDGRISEKFKGSIESTFVGRVHLCLPYSTATSPSMTHTDGVSIVHPNAIHTFYLPDNLSERSQLKLSKSIVLANNDPVIGYGSNFVYTYLIRAKGGVETVRLLPSGFNDETMGGETLIESLEERYGGELSDDVLEMRLFKKALLHFTCKRIAQSSNTLNELITNEFDIARTVQAFVQELCNGSGSTTGSVVADLRTKWLIFHRLILFLKSMNIFTQVCESEQPVVVPFKESVEYRSMGSLLQEQIERIDVAIGLAACQDPIERRVLELAAQHAATTYGMTEGGADAVFLTKLSNMHTLFPCILLAVSPLLTKATSAEARLDVISAAAHLLLSSSSAIEKNRRSHTSISIPYTTAQWTNGRLASAYLEMASHVLSELERDKEVHNLSITTVSRLNDMMTHLIIFGLSEHRGRVEGNKLLRRILDMGNAKLALELAERFKDFRLLVTITHSLEDEERKKLLETYKRRFNDDNFELYLCNYYLRHNMTHYLLEQRGDRVEAFMAEHDSIRWRRELQTERYSQAARSLELAACHEQKKLWNQKMYASLSYLSACCADGDHSQGMQMVKQKAQNILLLAQHQEQIPNRILMQAYPSMAECVGPLSMDEIIEVNLLDNDDVEERQAGITRALQLLSLLVEKETDDDEKEILMEKVANVWKETFDRQFYQLNKEEDFHQTLFARVFNAFLNNDSITAPTKLFLLPFPSLLSPQSNPLCSNLVSSAVERAKLLIV